MNGPTSIQVTLRQQSYTPTASIVVRHSFQALTDSFYH